MRTIITITTNDKPNPGTLNHLIALLANPNNRSSITVEFVE